MSTNCKHNSSLLSKSADLIGICNYAVVQATLPGIQNLGYKFWIIWVLIHKNRLAVQLHRPDEFIEADARIARGEAGNLGEKKRRSVSTERIETKEVV